MKLYEIGYGFFLFAFCMALHVIIWRWRHPKHHVIALLGLFLVFPGVLFTLYLFLSDSKIPLTCVASIGLLQFAFTCAYVQTYPAIQDVSPSLLLLPTIEKSKDRGITLEGLMSEVDMSSLLEERIQYLIEANLVRISNNHLKLTLRSAILVRLFIMMRHLLGLPIGRG